MSIETWLGAHLAAVSAVGGSTYSPKVLTEILPQLVRKGYELPVNLIVDVTAIYAEGRQVELRPPTGWLGRNAVRYCRGLVEETFEEDGIISKLLDARDCARRDHHHARSQSALVVFIEEFAQILYERYPATRTVTYPASIRAVLRDAVNKSLPKGETRHQAAETFVLNFLEKLSSWGARHAASSMPDVDDRSLMLLAAAESVELGNEALDLRLLQACRKYTLPPLNGLQATLHRRLLTAPWLRETRRSRTGASGYHGVEKGPGKVSEMLHTELARDDFEDRYYLKQTLHFEQRGHQEEPRRAFVACIVDRGVLMQSRTAVNRRRDSFALQWASCFIEDVVRYFLQVPALDMRLAILCHDGAGAKHFEIPPLALATAPAFEGPKDHIERGWLAEAPGFLPDFFLRTPIGDIPSGPVAGPKWLETIRLLAARRIVHELERSDLDRGGVCDLCHVAVFLPEPPLDAEECSAGLRCLKGISEQCALNFFICGERDMRWWRWPAARGDTQVIESFETIAPDGPIRLAAWEDIALRILRM